MFTFSLLSLSLDRSCKVNNGWRQFNTYIETGTGHADGTEVGLIFNVPAFKDAQSTLVLEYQVLCESICTFIIEEVRKGIRFYLSQSSLVIYLRVIKSISMHYFSLLHSLTHLFI